MNDRGIIKNVERAQQINDFSGLLYGKITPTDIDGMIEYKDKAYIFFELKYKGKLLPYGQKLALERLVMDTSKNDKISIALIIDHEVNNTMESVPVADCFVRELYFYKEQAWREPKEKLTTKTIIDMFLAMV